MSADRNYSAGVSFAVFSSLTWSAQVYYLAAFPSRVAQSDNLTEEKQMSKSLLLTISVFCTLLFLGCNKSESTTNRASSANAPAASPSAKAPSTMASGEKIGVPECDEFITAYEACVNDKVPAAARAQFKASVAQWRKSWHDLAANPKSKATLAGVCKTSLDQAKQS